MLIRYAKWIRRGRRRRGESGLHIFYSEDSQSSRFMLNNTLLENHNARFLFWSHTEPLGNVVMTAVCTEREGISRTPNETGYLIDAFDVNSGVFLDDPFVIVGPDHNLTQQANEQGFVPTSRMENILAYTSIYTEEFIDWNIWKEVEQDSIEALNLPVSARDSGTAFAFYGLPVGNLTVSQTPDLPRFPVPFYIPPESWHQFETGMSLAADINKFSKEFRSDILTLSAKIITSASKSITQGIMRMAEEDKKEPPKPPKLPTDILVKPAIKEKTLTTGFVSKKK